MNEPERLHDGAGSQLLRAMISAARDEQPSDHALEKTLLAVGAGGAVLGASAAAGGAAAGASSSALEVGGASSFAMVVKWLGFGAVAGLFTAGAAVQIDERAQPIRRAAPVVVSGSLEPARPRVEAPARGALEPAPRTDEPEQRAAKRRAGAAPFAASPELQEEDPSLNAEVAALDRARRSLAAGQADQALRELSGYDREFPGGRLGPEALFLRMEAAAQRGDQAAAERAARELVQHHPKSPHAARARAVLAGASNNP
jgi:hypothetical protein